MGEIWVEKQEEGGREILSVEIAFFELLKRKQHQTGLSQINI